jgi:tetratricopeptide (TPR) repeat protein
MKHAHSMKRSTVLAAILAISLAGCEGMMSTSSTFEDAESAFDQGQYRVANAHLSDLLSKGSVDDRVRKLQFELMLKLGDGNRAIAALEQLPEGALSEAERRQAFAHAHILQGSPQKTAELYRNLAEDDFSEQDFRMVLWALKEMGEGDDFAAGMDAGLDRFPDSPHLNALAADQLYDFGLPEEAGQFVDRAAENGPDVFEAQLVAGRKAIFEDELEEAIDHYRKAHEINPTNVLPLTNVAGLHLDLGQVEEAGEVLKIATQIDGDFPFLQWQLARYKLAVGDNQGAREAKDRVQRVYADNPEFILLMADIEAAFGNNRLALDNYRRFVREAGEVPEVMQKISELES